MLTKRNLKFSAIQNIKMRPPGKHLFSANSSQNGCYLIPFTSFLFIAKNYIIKSHNKNYRNPFCSSDSEN